MKMNEILKKRIDERLKIVEEGAVAFFTGEDSAVAAQYLELVKMAFTVGAEYALKSQWISIDEALPDCKINVIGRCRDGRIYVVRRCDYGPFYNWDVPTDIPPNYLSLHSGDVTHWMPIPEMEE